MYYVYDLCTYMYIILCLMIDSHGSHLISKARSPILLNATESLLAPEHGLLVQRFFEQGPCLPVKEQVLQLFKQQTWISGWWFQPL